MSRIVMGCLVAMLAVPAGTTFAQTRIKPGFNLFSVDQDLEIGRKSAQEVERQLPILQDRSLEAYVGAVGKRLAAVAPGGAYPYQFKIVNSAEINAFALPGGYLYLNRGLIEAATNEGQLAGVMAHEMAHVALRHGTNQASKAYLGQAGLGLLGGLIGRKDDDSTARTIGAIGGFGLNVLFLKFSRTDEEQADVVGAQMMARAGYNPKDMVDFFEMLRVKQSREPSKVERFFSDHPAPQDRAARIRREMALLKIQPTQPVGGFQAAKSELLAMSRPPSTQIARKQASASGAQAVKLRQRAFATQVNRPSSTFRRFEQHDGFFEIDYPDDWRVYEPANGLGVTLAPEGGFVDTGGAEPDLVYGVIVNHYDPFNNDERKLSADGGRFRIDGNGFVDGNGRKVSHLSLAGATNDLLGQILQTNSKLRMVPNSQRNDVIDGAPSLSLVLSGPSPVTREEERVTVFTRELSDDHVIYALFIAPGEDYEELRATFNRMISSLRVTDEASHGSHAGASLGSSPSASTYSSGGGRSIPAGTAFSVEFQQPLSSSGNKAGDRFTARVVEPVVVSGRVVIPEGSIVTGEILEAIPSRSIGGRARLDLRFSSLRLPSGSESPISASLRSEGKSQTGKDAAAIGGGAAAGALLGRILAHDGKENKGTVIGALIGGAIGTGIAARNAGEEVTLPQGTVVEIQLDSPVED